MGNRNRATPTTQLTTQNGGRSMGLAERANRRPPEGGLAAGLRLAWPPTAARDRLQAGRVAGRVEGPVAAPSGLGDAREAKGSGGCGDTPAG